MRLINADALKEATKHYTDSDGFNPVWQIIDNSPTECELYRSFCMAKQRPQGEWIIDGHHRRCNYCNEYTCTEDREGNSIPDNFCPKCGAKMKGGAE